MTTVRVLLLSTLLCLIVVVPRVATGQQPPIPAIPPGDDVIVPLGKGQAAPFDGQFFDTNTALRWGNFLLQYKYRLQVDVQEQQDLCAVRTDALKKDIVVEQEKYDKVVTAYDQKMAEMAASSSPAWYETPWIGFVAGTVLTTAAAGVIIWAANSGSN